MSFLGLLLISAFICNIHESVAQAERNYDMSDLLKPQQGFEINLILPNSSFVSSHSLPLALTQGMEYLTRNHIPFRLLHNIKSEMQPPSPARTARHGRNRIGNLVFIASRGNTKRLDLEEAVLGCTFTSRLVFSSVVHKDFTQVIVEVTSLKETYEWAVAPTLLRQLVPLYIIMLYWLDSGFTSSGVDLIRETCECDDHSSMIQLEEAWTQLRNDDNGIENLLNRIRDEKKNFRRRKLVVLLGKAVLGSWEEFWEQKVLGFRFTSAHTGDFGDAYAGVLTNFYSVHNFTFDTIDAADVKRDPVSGKLQDGVIRTWSSSKYLPLHRSMMVPRSLSEFLYFSTLSFSNPAEPESSKLESLAAPFTQDPVASIVLLGFCFSVVLLLLKISGEGDISGTTLSVFSGLVSQSNGNGTTGLQNGCKAGWLLLIGFISITYTNILQSTVVVPSVHSNHLNIEDMLQDNYRFVTYAYALRWMKKRFPSLHNSSDERCSLKAKKSKSIEMLEAMLTLRLEGNFEFDQMPWRSLIEEFSQSQKNVLIFDKGSIEMWNWIPREVGRDLVVGKEQLFFLPFWWSFGNVERGLLLAQSLELFRQVGFVHYFLDLADANDRKLIVAAARKEFLDTGFDSGSGVDLTDSLVRESFMLFLYGISIAVAGFLCEIISSWIAAVVYSRTVRSCKVAPSTDRTS